MKLEKDGFGDGIIIPDGFDTFDTVVRFNYFVENRASVGLTTGTFTGDAAKYKKDFPALYEAFIAQLAFRRLTS